MTDYQAVNPTYSLATGFVTFDEAIERLLDLFGLERSARNERNAVRAVVEAYRDMPKKRDWGYWTSRLIIPTVAQITDGTAAYDHTGNVAGERLVTMSTGTLPDDVELYVFEFNGVTYEVDRRIDATHFQLTERANPGADVAATSYRLYRDAYLLPADFRRAEQLFDVQSKIPLTPVLPGDGLWQSRVVGTGMPQSYSFQSLPRRAGARAVVFSPAPSAARTYECICYRGGRPLNVRSYSEGTVSVSSGSRSLTSSGAVFTAAHQGCVIRFGTASSVPTPQAGGLDDGVPFLMERVIRSVDSSSTATLDAPADQAFTAVKYAISAPIDISSGEMETYFYRLCEAKFALLEQKPDATKLMAVADAALLEAAAADNMNAAVMQVAYAPTSLADLGGLVSP